MLKKITVSLFIFTIALGCTQKTENTPVATTSKKELATIDSLTKLLDIKDSIIFTQQETITLNSEKISTTPQSEHLKPKKEVTKLTAQEKSLRSFCKTITADFINLEKLENQNDLLENLAPSYSVNWVIVKGNEAQVARYTNNDFKKALKKIGKEGKKLHLELVKLDFLAYDFNGELFNATYKVYLNEFSNDKLIGKRSATFSIAGRKKESYKVANLNTFIFSFGPSHIWN